MEKKVIGYARISTDKQEADRQKLDIYAFAEKEGLAVTKVITETVSSRKDNREIYKIIESLNEGDVLIVTELSRLARSMMELNGIISDIRLKRKAVIKVISGVPVDDSIESQALVFALGIAAQIEREMISERTKSALRAKKSQGIKLGRPVGKGGKVDEAISTSGRTVDEINALIKAGLKAPALAKLLGLDARTVREWMKL